MELGNEFEGEVEQKRKTPVLKWRTVASWSNVYDPATPPPVFRGPKWDVTKVMLNMTLSEPTVRGGSCLLEVIQKNFKEVSG